MASSGLAEALAKRHAVYTNRGHTDEVSVEEVSSKCSKEVTFCESKGGFYVDPNIKNNNKKGPKID